MTGKRQLPSHDSPLLPKYKRRAIETEPSEKDQDEVEYVAMMLVPSQEKKEIEPSAGELHQEWNDSISGSHSSGLLANSSLPKQVQSNIQQHDKKSIYISDDEILLLESDEDMARRLQQEWAASDDDDVLVGSSKLLPQDTRHIDGKGKAPERLLIQPTIKVEDITGSAEESLARFRELFVRSRNCIKCGKRLSSPRGCVSYACSNSLQTASCFCSRLLFPHKFPHQAYSFSFTYLVPTVKRTIAEDVFLL